MSADGYAFEFHGPRWRVSLSAHWDTVVHTASAGDFFVGTKYIDGALCNVWNVGPDHYIAQVRLG